MRHGADAAPLQRPRTCDTHCLAADAPRMARCPTAWTLTRSARRRLPRRRGVLTAETRAAGAAPDGHPRAAPQVEVGSRMLRCALLRERGRAVRLTGRRRCRPPRSAPTCWTPPVRCSAADSTATATSAIPCRCTRLLTRSCTSTAACSPRCHAHAPCSPATRRSPSRAQVKVMEVATASIALHVLLLCSDSRVYSLGSNHQGQVPSAALRAAARPADGARSAGRGGRGRQCGAAASRGGP
jgi:hypothetical protein